MIDPVSIPQAAKALGLSPSRVQVLVANGQVPGIKIGGRWLIERSEVERRSRAKTLRGRPFAPHNAWVLLRLASGEAVEGVDPSVRSRLSRAVALEGLSALAPRLDRRARSHHYEAHPGEVNHLFEDPRFIASGVSAAAAHGIDLVPGGEADGYVRAGDLPRFVADHALRSAGPGSNLRLRAVPDKAWNFMSKDRVAPVAAVALDLAEDPDPRSSQAGQAALRTLESP